MLGRAPAGRLWATSLDHAEFERSIFPVVRITRWHRTSAAFAHERQRSKSARPFYGRELFPGRRRHKTDGLHRWRATTGLVRGLAEVARPKARPWPRLASRTA